MATVSTDRRRGINSSAAIKVPCICASTANLTLSGEQTIDGIAVVEDDRVFAKDQTDATEIGIYTVATGTWTRAPDWDGNYDVVEGTIVPVSRGTTNADTYWKVTNTGAITIGTTEITVAATTVLSSAILNDGTVKMIADFSPNTTDTYDLGTSSLKWQDLHLNGAATIGGSVHMDDGILLLDKGANVASAGALTLGSDGNYFDITGTTTITSIASKGIGTVVRLHFDGALTLTHHATDLVLPGSANITTAAGDEATFVEYDTADWRCVNYQPASKNVTFPALATSQASTSGTTLDFTVASGAMVVYVVFAEVGTDGTADWQIVLGASGGLEATGYAGATQELNSANTISHIADSTGFIISGTSGAARDLSGIITLCRVNSSHLWVASGTLMEDSSGAVSSVVGGAKTLSGELTTVRVGSLGGAANFDSGEITIIYT